MTYYQGGKNRIGREIAGEILENSDDTLPYFEPFMGMLGVGKWIMEDSIDNDIGREFTFCDKSEDIVCMWQAAKDGWKPPMTCPGNAFNKLKHSDELSARRTFIGHACAFNGNYFSTHRCVHLKKDGVKPQAERVSLIGDLLNDVDAKLPNAKSYKSFKPNGSVIYCDPPYKGNNLNGGINRKDFTKNKFRFNKYSNSKFKYRYFNKYFYWDKKDLYKFTNQYR